MTAPRIGWALLAVVVFAACSSSSSSGGSGSDGGVQDAGAVDAGAQDAGAVDAGPTDAGALDAGPVDAGAVDAGPTDAGALDAGPEDAGPVDAGAQDAGPEDAGVDAGPDYSGIHLTLTLHRNDDAGILADAFLSDDAGAPVTGQVVDIAWLYGLDVGFDPDGGGHYLSYVDLPHLSAEYPVVATLDGTTVSASRTALFLATVGAGWEQPEPVGGLVNTPGTEDSSTVSPDGQWLIVGTYSPVDVLGCQLAAGTGPADGRNSECQLVQGPYAAPARPNMPGADRILGPDRVINGSAADCALGVDGGDFVFDVQDGGIFDFALPPVTAYGFHRQPDGTFAEPFVIHVDDDGFTGAPFCFTFLGTPSGLSAPVVFAYAATTGINHPYVTQLALGQENVLGTTTCQSGTPQFTPNAIFPLPVGPVSQNAGNTSVAQGFLFSDDETQSPPVTLSAAAYDDGGFADWAPLALPSDGDDRRQPVQFGDRVYYARNSTVVSTAWSLGDPTLSTSFDAPVTELAADPIPGSGLAGLQPGQVFGLGQPTFATVDGGVELYFVYYRRTATGTDGQIGVVRHR